MREIALELVRADGSRLPVLVNAALKRDADGEPAARARSPSSTRPTAAATSASSCGRARDAELRAAAASALEHVAEGVVLLDDDGPSSSSTRPPRASSGSRDGRGRGRRSRRSCRTGTRRGAHPRRPARAPPRPVVVPARGRRPSTRWLAASAEAAPDGIVYTLRDVTARAASRGHPRRHRRDRLARAAHAARRRLRRGADARRARAALGEEQRLRARRR